MKLSKADVQKRRKKLLALFEEQPTLSVIDASEALQVSPITIRRDLDLLEQQKLVVRFHGGARLASAISPTVPQLSVRDHLQLEQKRQIAKYVATLVADRNTIFLNAGSTTYLTIKELTNRPVRIVTNNVRAIELFQDAQAELIMPGGEYNAHNCSFLGDLSTHLLSHLRADLCILGVNGIKAPEGVTTYSYQESLLNKTMLRQCSGRRIVVADGTKIGKLFCFTSTALDDIDMLVTDSSADAELLEQIASQNVEVVLADCVPE